MALISADGVRSRSSGNLTSLLAQVNVAEAWLKELMPGRLAPSRVESARLSPRNSASFTRAFPLHASDASRSDLVAPRACKAKSPEASPAKTLSKVGESAESAPRSMREKSTLKRYDGIAAKSASNVPPTLPP